jgi:glyoxylase-like metal-dependent hydrolase (beta-lactamase superfamily II)
MRTGVLALFLLLLTHTAAAQPLARTAELARRGLAPADFPRIVRLAPNVFAYEAVHKQGAFTTNSLIVITADGVLIADGQGTPEQVRRLTSDVGKLTSRPVKYLVIGSHHTDHVGGNAAFPEGVTLIATPTSYAALDDSMRRTASGALRPVIEISEGVGEWRVLQMGGTRIEIGRPGRTHTGGDLIVRIAPARVLYLSETFLHRMFPTPAAAYPTEWIEAVKRIEQMDARWFVPGHGFVDDAATLKEELTRFRQAMEKVRSEGSRLMRSGVPVEEAAARADFGEFTDWSRREEMAAPALRQVYAALSGQLR